MKHLIIPLFTFTFFFHLSASAAVPLRWTVETSSANPATFDQFAGATYDLEAALQSRGKPLAVDGEPHLYWQTNGMGSAWWTAPATVSGNVLRATWTPACDVGARVYNCFIGITGTTYNAAFQLRLRQSPGATPNELPLPQKVIDFSQVTVLNPPWPSGAARPLPKFLHVIDYYDTYPADAAWYYSQPQDYGSCSAVRDGNTLSRNYDWKYDDAAEFVVRMSAGPGRLSSIGVANCGTNLTESFVTSGKSSRYYKCLPGRTVDGINEKGVSVEVNVVDGDPQWRSGVLSASDIHPLAAVRWALDNGTSAGMAASNLAARIRFPSGWTQNFHWMIADETQTWIVENGAASNMTGRAVMTNFPLIDRVDGMGLERYNLLVGGESITNAWFTRAYSRSTNWESEFKDADEMEAAKSAWETYGREELRSKGLWQTVHTSIYDIQNRILRIAVQETDDWYTFSVPSSVTPEDLAAKRDKTDTCVYVPKLIAVTIDGLAADRLEWNSDTARWEHYMTSVIEPIGNGMLKYISTQLPQGEIIFKEYDDEVDFDYGPGLIHLKFESSGLAKVNDRLATTNDLAAVIGDSTNAAIRAVSRAFRRLHDEHVYVPGVMGPFAYESDNPGLVEAIGDRQPTEYSYGDDYAEYDLYFQYDGYDVNAYGYGRTTDDIINFSGHGFRYNPSTGYDDWIDVYFVGRREAGEWVMTSDTFARESALTQIRSDISQIRNTIGGETKVMRQGGEFEYGSGWGYVQQVMDNDVRKWRIRVPRWTGVSGLATNDTSASIYYFTRTNGTYRSPFTGQGLYYNPYAVMNGILSWVDGWGLSRKLVRTRGIYGNDGTQYADYRVGLFFRDAERMRSPAVEFDVVQTTNSPMSFAVTPVVDGLYPIRSMTNSTNVAGTMMSDLRIRYLDVPDYTRTWTWATSYSYSVNYSYEITLTAHIIGVMVRDGPAYVTSGDFSIEYWLLYDCAWHVVQRNQETGEEKTADSEASEVVSHGVVTVTCGSSSTMEDLIVPYYRILSTRDPNLYYDKFLDETYRISVSNGCFFSEKVMDGDWRISE